MKHQRTVENINKAFIASLGLIDINFYGHKRKMKIACDLKINYKIQIKIYFIREHLHLSRHGDDLK